MANITIVDIKPAGAEFFAESENFLGDITDEELNISGGITPLLPLSFFLTPHIV